MMRLLAFLIGSAFLLGAATPARAGFQFQFADSTGATVSGNQFNIDPSPGFVDIRVYIQATGATDIGVLRNDGLRSFGVKLSYGGVQAQVLNTAAISSNSLFDDVATKQVTTTSALINDSILGSSATVKAGATEDRIFLATFRFTGLNNGTMTSVTIDPDPTIGGDDTVTGANAVLDGLIANSTATLVVVVPEPGTIALTGLFAVGLAGAAFRRWKRARAAA